MTSTQWKARRERQRNRRVVGDRHRYVIEHQARQHEQAAIRRALAKGPPQPDLISMVEAVGAQKGWTVRIGRRNE